MELIIIKIMAVLIMDRKFSTKIVLLGLDLLIVIKTYLSLFESLPVLYIRFVFTYNKKRKVSQQDNCGLEHVWVD